MPFFEHVGPGDDDYNGNPKRTVRLRQLASTAPKTSFRCLDVFGWSDLTPGVPEADSRVPHKTETDLASIPPFLWGLIASYGRHTMPAILHDVRCVAADNAVANGGRAHQAYLRRRADHQFRVTLRAHADLGVVTRYVVWSAVRLFGFTPIGAGILLGVVLSLLHQSSDVFVAISAILEKVTIWPWLSWLDWIPQGIAAILAAASTWLAPSEPYAAIMAVLAVLVATAVVYRSFEKTTPNGPAGFSLTALVSMICAAVVGVLTAPPLLPLVLVTVLTRLVLWLLDLVSHWLERAYVKVLQIVLGSAPAQVQAQIPQNAMKPARRPPYPGLFPRP